MDFSFVPRVGFGVGPLDGSFKVYESKRVVTERNGITGISLKSHAVLQLSTDLWVVPGKIGIGVEHRQQAYNEYWTSNMKPTDEVYLGMSTEIIGVGILDGKLQQSVGPLRFKANIPDDSMTIRLGWFELQLKRNPQRTCS